MEDDLAAYICDPIRNLMSPVALRNRYYCNADGFIPALYLTSISINRQQNHASKRFFVIRLPHWHRPDFASHRRATISRVRWMERARPQRTRRSTEPTLLERHLPVPTIANHHFRTSGGAMDAQLSMAGAWRNRTRQNSGRIAGGRSCAALCRSKASCGQNSSGCAATGTLGGRTRAGAAVN